IAFILVRRSSTLSEFLFFLTVFFFSVIFFFFQAEDGIRDRNVTGVQTCALPILLRKYSASLFSDTAFSTFTSQCQSKNWTSFDFQVCPPQLLHLWLVSRFNAPQYLHRTFTISLTISDRKSVV